MTGAAAVRAHLPAGPRRWTLVAGACTALAAASLAVPSTLGYDPWAWLVWGREIGRWSLDTTGGPSWKPLPVAGTTLLAPLGALAVPAYLVVARAAALLAVVAVARLGERLGGPVAGALAGAAVLVLPDGDPRFVRLVLEAHEAPWSAGLAAAALVALLDGRPGRALWWTWLLSLLRPEAWPFLLALAVCAANPPLPTTEPRSSGRARRSARSCVWWTRARRSSVAGRVSLRWAVAALASIPLLWFVPDWMGSGRALHGADTAQVLADEPAGARLVDGLRALIEMAPAPVWALAAVLVVRRGRGHDRVPAALAAVALAWAVLVVAMAAGFGYAAISRFFLPPAFVLVALAGAGAVDIARSLQAWDHRPRARGAGLALVATGVALLAPRVVGIPGIVEEVRDRGRLERDLDETIDAAGGADALGGCGAAVVTARTLLRSAAAWKLDLPLHDVERAVADRRAVLLLESARAARLAGAAPGTVELASGERWSAFAVHCPELTRPLGVRPP